MPPRKNQVFQPIGTQKVARFQAGAAERTSSVLVDHNQDPEALIDVVIQGFNVRLQITTGTAKGARIADVQCPARFSVTGSLTVECFHDDLDEPGSAWPQVARVSARSAPQVAGVLLGPATLQAAAVRATAFDACVVTVQGIAVALAPGESFEFRGPAVLTSGTALIGYEV
jgi:hypothetical protein